MCCTYGVLVDLRCEGGAVAARNRLYGITGEVDPLFYVFARVPPSDSNRLKIDIARLASKKSSFSEIIGHMLGTSLLLKRYFRYAVMPSEKAHCGRKATTAEEKAQRRRRDQSRSILTGRSGAGTTRAGRGTGSGEA